MANDPASDGAPAAGCVFYRPGHRADLIQVNRAERGPEHRGDPGPPSGR